MRLTLEIDNYQGKPEKLIKYLLFFNKVGYHYFTYNWIYSPTNPKLIIILTNNKWLKNLYSEGYSIWVWPESQILTRKNINELLFESGPDTFFIKTNPSDYITIKNKTTISQIHKNWYNIVMGLN